MLIKSFESLLETYNYSYVTIWNICLIDWAGFYVCTNTI